MRNTKYKYQEVSECFYVSSYGSARQNNSTKFPREFQRTLIAKHFFLIKYKITHYSFSFQTPYQITRTNNMKLQLEDIGFQPY